MNLAPRNLQQVALCYTLENSIKSNNGNVDQSFCQFSDQVQFNLRSVYPSKKDFKQKLNFINKPWIALGLQKSTSVKNHLFTKYKQLKMSLQKMRLKSNINNTKIYFLL